MPKVRVLSGSQVCAILAAHGFLEVPRRGSHVVMQRVVAGSTVTVPVPDHRELRAGTLASIMRQCGLGREVFEVS